jgi:hypothetical protein
VVLAACCQAGGNGWSCQQPVRQAIERDDAAVEVWKKQVRPQVSLGAALGAWLVFEDEAGVSMTPARARTWGHRGRTPAVRVRGRSRRRVSIAALTGQHDPRPDGPGAAGRVIRTVNVCSGQASW